MGKNVSPPIKAFILSIYLLIVTLVSASGGGEALEKLDLSNSSVIMFLKVTQALSVIFLFVIPVIVFLLFTSEKKLGYLNLKPFQIASGLATVVLVFTVMPVINWMGEINSHLSFPDFMSGIETWMKEKEEGLKKLTDIFLQMDTMGDLAINIVVVALLAAVAEEFFFRGAIQNVLLEWTNKVHLSVWVTAILFSAMHTQFYGFLPRMLLGVVLGYLYVWSGSLWLSILFHFLNNGMAVFFAYLVGKGAIGSEVETIGTGETPMYYILVSLLISIGLMYFVYIQKGKNPAPSPGV